MQDQRDLFVLITQITSIQRRKKPYKFWERGQAAPRHNTYRENKHLSEVLHLPVFSQVNTWGISVKTAKTDQRNFTDGQTRVHLSITLIEFNLFIHQIKNKLIQDITSSHYLKLLS